MSVVNTIIPWTSEWLLHYELWHATGKWLGGGHRNDAGPKLPSSSEAQVDE